MADVDNKPTPQTSQQWVSAWECDGIKVQINAFNLENSLPPMMFVKKAGSDQNSPIIGYEVFCLPDQEIEFAVTFKGNTGFGLSIQGVVDDRDYDIVKSLYAISPEQKGMYVPITAKINRYQAKPSRIKVRKLTDMFSSTSDETKKSPEVLLQVWDVSGYELAAMEDIKKAVFSSSSLPSQSISYLINFSVQLEKPKAGFVSGTTSKNAILPLKSVVEDIRTRRELRFNLKTTDNEAVMNSLIQEILQAILKQAGIIEKLEQFPPKDPQGKSAMNKALKLLKDKPAWKDSAAAVWLNLLEEYGR